MVVAQRLGCVSPDADSVSRLKIVSDVCVCVCVWLSFHTMPEEGAMDAALAKLYDADRDVREACAAARLSKVGTQSI